MKEELSKFVENQKSVLGYTGYPVSVDASVSYIKRIYKLFGSRMLIDTTKNIEEAQVFGGEATAVLEYIKAGNVAYNPTLDDHVAHVEWRIINRESIGDADTLTQTLINGVAKHNGASEFLEGIEFAFDTLIRVGIVSPTIKDKITEQLHAIQEADVKQFFS